MEIRTTITAIIGATSILLAGCAFDQSRAETIDPAADARVVHACKDIMGFPPGEVRYDDCVESLRHTVAGIARASRLQAAHTTCLNKSLTPGTPEFSRCVLSNSEPSFQAAGKQS